MLRHHSAVELLQRAESAGLVARVPDPDDGRVMRLALSRRGRTALERLSDLHMEEIERLADRLHPTL